MKAIRVAQFGEPEVMEVQEVAAPVPAAGQVLVRLHAAGVNPVETYIRSGKYARIPALPYTPGNDGAGVVEKSNAAGVTEGARVYATGSVTGTYAEMAVCAAEQVCPLPERVSYEQGAALGIPYGTAAWALFNRGQAKSGETLLIHGASGGVGLAALQLAVAAGMKVYGTAGTSEGMELVKKNGAVGVFSHGEAGYLDKIKEASNGGVDMVLEMAAHHNLGNDLTLISPGGRVVVVGSRGPVEIDARNIMARNADIRGVMLTAACAGEVYPRITAGLEKGELSPVIGCRFALGEAAEAHERIMAPGAVGKIVLTM